MKTIVDDPEGFFEQGGWSFLEPEGEVWGRVGAPLVEGAFPFSGRTPCPSLARLGQGHTAAERTQES